MSQQPDNPWDELQARLGVLEQAWFSEDRERRLEILSGLLDLLQDCTEAGRYAGVLLSSPEQAGMVCTRLATLLANLVMAESFALSESALIALSVARWVVKDVFRLSGYRGTLSFRILLMRRLARRQDGEGAPPPASDLPDETLLCLLLSCLDDVLPEHLDALLAAPGPRAAIVALSLLSDRSALTPAGETARERLLLAEGLYEQLPVYHSLRNLVAIAWMHCSYAATPRKHDIKRRLNGWFRQLADANGLVATAKRRPRQPGDKPVLMFVSEMFRSGHAMFRWYSPICRALREHFTLHLMSLTEEVDATSIALFDRFIPVKDFTALKTALKLYAPDIIYFPSVGMRAWAITLANVRWAPVQVMSLGHPATSHSDVMDGVLVQSNLFGGEGIFAENVLLQDNKANSSIARHAGLVRDVRAAPGQSRQALRLAVPCISLKLNNDFLAALDRIIADMPVPVIVEFYPNETGLALLSTTCMLRSRFPDAVVHHRTDYQRYLEHLSRAHLALSPFPFGNASSIVDVLHLGLPVVALRGREPHAMTDHASLDVAGMSELCVDSPDAYVALARRLLLDVDYTMSVHGRLCDGRFETLYAQADQLAADVAHAPIVTETVSVFTWLMAHPEVLVDRGRIIDARSAWHAETESARTSESG